MSSFKKLELGFLLDNQICPSCGGEIQLNHNFCPFCKNKLGEFAEKFKEIESILRENLTVDIPLNIENSFNLITLYSIKNQVTSKILANFLEQQKVIDKINYFIEEVNKKIVSNQKLNLEEDHIYYNLLQNKLIPENKIYSKYIIKKVFLKEPIVSQEVFFEIIKKMVIAELKLYNSNRLSNYEPKCIIKNLNLGENSKTTYTGGEAFGYKIIYLDTKVMQDLYKGNILSFQIILHEIYHVIDKIDKITGVFTCDIVRQIKEDIIRECEIKEAIKIQMNPKFYNNNYSVISNEKDAQIKSFIFLLRFLDELGLSLTQEFKEDIQEQIKQELKQKENLLRNVENNPNFTEDIASIDEIFEFYIKNHPEYLKKYPQLTIGYIEEDNMVRLKTKSELLESYLNINNPEISKYIRQQLGLIKERYAKGK